VPKSNLPEESGRSSPTSSVIGEIKRTSMTRPMKVVVDEVLGDRRMRVLVSRMRPGFAKDDFLDLKAWEDDVVHVINGDDLGGLLTQKQHASVREGKVYIVHQKKVDDVHEEVRKHIKDKVNKLLVREGRTKAELPRPPDSKGA